MEYTESVWLGFYKILQVLPGCEKKLTKRLKLGL